MEIIGREGQWEIVRTGWIVEPESDVARLVTLGEVVRAALQLLEKREMERFVRLEELRKEIAMGIEHSDRGDIFDGEEVIRELRAEIWQAEQGEE